MMRAALLRMLPILAAAFVLWIAVPLYHSGGGLLAQVPAGEPQGSPANATTQTVDKQGNPIRCDAITESQGGVLLGRIVPCALYTIEAATQRFSAAMIDWLMPVVWSFITLVIVFFGIKILQGEGQLQGQVIVLLIKIGFVIAVLQMIPGTLVPMTYKILNEGQAVVMSSIAEETELKCNVEKFAGGSTPMIWAQLDCLLGELYGFTTGQPDASGNKRPNMLLASSIFGLLSGFFFGGTVGVALFMVMIGVLISLFTLIMRVVMVYTTSFMIVSFYMIIAPLFVPLMLLRVTTDYFNKWWNAILAAFILPMLITAYVMMAMQIYDRILFREDSPLRKILTFDIIKDAQELPSSLCDKTVMNDPAAREGWLGGTDLNQFYKNNPSLINPNSPLMSAGNNLCSGLKKTSLRLDNLKAHGPEFETMKSAFTALFREAILLLIVAWLVSEGSKYIIGIIRPMIGSNAVVNAIDTKTPMESRLSTGFASAQRSFKDSFSERDGQALAGTEFLQRVPIGIRNAIGSPMARPGEAGDTGFFAGFRGNR